MYLLSRKNVLQSATLPSASMYSYRIEVSRITVKSFEFIYKYIPHENLCYAKVKVFFLNLNLREQKQTELLTKSVLCDDCPSLKH